MKEERKEVIVVGGGPGGYTAAFRAADLGKKVTIIERYPTLRRRLFKCWLYSF